MDIIVPTIQRINVATFVGKGKVQELASRVKSNKADLVIFDDDLSNVQVRNIEKEVGCKLLDRSALILDIFARNARTATAKTQVELAQLEYLLPRLTRHWTHLSRQKGGIGMRGPGETQIETDRRLIGQRISSLKERLVKIDRQRTTQRKGRSKFTRVSLVGYTNAGKSTLMNELAGAGVLAENRLFATLDSTTRTVELLPGREVLLSDTVGFIRKLPHRLIESFKSTLDEVRESDILMHVMDASHRAFREHKAVVRQGEIDSATTDLTSKPLVVAGRVEAEQRHPEAVLAPSRTVAGTGVAPIPHENRHHIETKAQVWVFSCTLHMHRNCQALSAGRDLQFGVAVCEWRERGTIDPHERGICDSECSGRREITRDAALFDKLHDHRLTILGRREMHVGRVGMHARANSLSGKCR